MRYCRNCGVEMGTGGGPCGGVAGRPHDFVSGKLDEKARHRLFVGRVAQLIRDGVPVVIVTQRLDSVDARVLAALRDKGARLYVEGEVSDL